MDDQNLCRNIKPQISEFVDGTLSPNAQWRLQGHLARCPECGQLARDLQSNRAMLQALPRQQTSDLFESHLAARLAQSRRGKKTWRTRLAAFLAPPLPGWPQQARRAGLALSAAAVIIAGAADLSFNLHPMAMVAHPLVSPAGNSDDQSLVSHCLQEHSRYVAAQPLSDPAAQNLVTHLDGNSLSAADFNARSDAGSL